MKALSVGLFLLGCAYHDVALTIRDPSLVQIQVTETSTGSFRSAVRGESSYRNVLEATLGEEPTVVTQPAAAGPVVAGIRSTRAEYTMMVGAEDDGYSLYVIERGRRLRTRLLSAEQQLIVSEGTLTHVTNMAWRSWPGRPVTLEGGSLGLHWWEPEPVMSVETFGLQIPPVLLVSFYTPISNIERVDRIRGLRPGYMRRVLGGAAVIGLAGAAGAGAFAFVGPWRETPGLTAFLGAISVAFTTATIWLLVQALRRREVRPSSLEGFLEQTRARVVSTPPESTQ